MQKVKPSVLLVVRLALSALAKPADGGAVSAKITSCRAGKERSKVKRSERESPEVEVVPMAVSAPREDIPRAS